MCISAIAIFLCLLMREPRTDFTKQLSKGQRREWEGYKEEIKYLLEIGLGLIAGPVLFLIHQVLRPNSIEI